MRRRSYERADGPLFRQPPHRTKRLVTVPVNAGPHVRLLFALMREQGRILDDVAEASGIRRPCMKSWRNRSYPTLESLEATFGALGWSFTPCPRIEVLPENIAADLGRIAAQMKIELPVVFSALLEIAAGHAFLRERAKERIEAREAARAALGTKRARYLKRPANDNTPRRKRAAKVS